MSKRSEEFAKRYSEEFILTVDHKGDVYEACIDAYHQAEQDLALTIKDIELLHTFLYTIKNNKQGYFTFTRLSDEQYEEVLRRFREMKRQIPKEEEK